MTEQNILNNVPSTKVKSAQFSKTTGDVYRWSDELWRSVADIKEILALREENKVFRFKFAMTEISLKTRTTHLTSCEAALESRDELNENLLAEIAQLKKDLNTAESIIIKTADNIIEMDNCEQDSDEMDECWTVIKEFALIATGRVDS